MKKFLALALCTLMIVSLVACSPAASKVSIDDFEEEFEIDFDIDETDSGYEFKYEEEKDFILEYKNEYFGTANSDKKVRSFKIKYSNIPEELITDIDDMEEAVKLLLTAPGKLTSAKFAATYCYADMVRLYGLFEEENAIAEPFDADELTEAALDHICNEKTRTINGWTVSVSASGETVEITAEFN